MSAPQDGRYDNIARRWLALVERRQAYFLELCDSGRWQRYYTQAEFIDEMRKVLRVRAQWAAIAGVAAPDDDELPPLVDRAPPRPRPLSAGIPATPWPTGLSR
jgi:uncharacterized repeat protein (TIGR03809 family)